MDGDLIINDKKYFISKHALHRANRRKVTLGDIIECIYNPRHIHSVDHGKNEKRWCYAGRNHVNVILNFEKTVIITVLRANKEYRASRTKQQRNKNRVKRKRLFGNRARN